MAGIPAGILRFCAHIPIFMQATTSLNVYNAIKDHDALRNYEPSWNLARNELIGTVCGFVGAGYNFLAWIPTFASPAEVLFLFGLVDTAITGCLIASTKGQTAYTPQTKGGCSRADEWPMVEGMKSFYTLVSDFSSPVDGVEQTPQSSCNSFINAWILKIVVITIYGLISVFNIGLPLIMFSVGSSSMYRGRYYYSRTKRDFGGFMLSIVCAPLTIIWFFIPRFLQNRMIYAVRYCRKYIEHRRSVQNPVDLEARAGRTDGLHMNTFRPRKALGKDSPRQKSLEKFLGNFDVLSIIAYNLHYEDLVNLSLTCKTARSAIFSPQLKGNRAKLRVYSCRSGVKSECYVCAIQVCDDCKAVSVPLKQTTTSSHVGRCVLKCNDCFFKSLVAARRTRNSHVCMNRCDPSSSNGYPYNRPRPPSLVRITMCKGCSALTTNQKEVARDARERDSVSKLVLMNQKCSECLVKLPDHGPRWWICGRCRGECRNSIHPGWA